MYKSLIKLMQEHAEFGKETFITANAHSSLIKLKDEIGEVEQALYTSATNLAEEYADCMMCLIDSAARAGITPNMIKSAFAKKLKKNKGRKWMRNGDNTYSHVKNESTFNFNTDDSIPYL